MGKKMNRKYFSKPLLEETLQLLPLAVEHPDSATFQEILRDKLPQNSDITRGRYARYIANRYSINGRLNIQLARFIKAFGSLGSSKEVLFFEMLQAEPVLMSVQREFMSSNIGQNCSNEELEEFLLKIVPGKKVKEVRGAVSHALTFFNRLFREKPGKFIIQVIDPGLPEVLYVLHRLFPEVGMYRADQFLSSNEVASLLWNGSRIKDLLYLAWHKGYLAKVTEIDRFFHLSTKYSFDELLTVLEAEAKEAKKSA